MKERERRGGRDREGECEGRKGMQRGEAWGFERKALGRETDGREQRDTHRYWVKLVRKRRKVRRRWAREGAPL